MQKTSELQHQTLRFRHLSHGYSILQRSRTTFTLSWRLAGSDVINEANLLKRHYNFQNVTEVYVVL